jgi:hypothetical protein
VEVKEIVVSRTVRMNTGNYEGTEHFVSMKAEVDGLDDEQEATRELALKVELAMVRQLRHSYAARSKPMKEAGVARHHGLGLALAELKE